MPFCLIPLYKRLYYRNCADDSYSLMYQSVLSIKHSFKNELGSLEKEVRTEAALKKGGDSHVSASI